MQKEFEEEVLKKMLDAMSFTDLDLLEEYKQFISKSNVNGISQAVWARRSDILVEHFKNYSNMKVLHIKRSPFWQIDPILNLETGVLYLLFSESNLDKVRRDFINRGLTTHYAYLFLQRSLATEIIDGSNLELFPMEKASDEMEVKRNKEICKMLGIFAEECKDIVFVSVTYYDKIALAASAKKFTPEFQLSEEHDISHLLSVGYKGDSTRSMGPKGKGPNDDGPNITPAEMPLVTLKNNVKTNE